MLLSHVHMIAQNRLSSQVNKGFTRPQIERPAKDTTKTPAFIPVSQIQGIPAGSPKLTVTVKPTTGSEAVSKSGEAQNLMRFFFVSVPSNLLTSVPFCTCLCKVLPWDVLHDASRTVLLTIRVTGSHRKLRAFSLGFLTARKQRISVLRRPEVCCKHP